MKRRAKPAEPETLPADQLSFYAPGAYDGLAHAFDFIPGMLHDSTVAMIYGPPGSGKTFFALHLLCAVALGREVFGMRTERRNALYVGLEGEASIKTRIQAWCAQNGVASNPIGYALGKFNLAMDDDVTALIQNMLANGIRFLVIDTLSIAAAGLDEISAADMSIVLDALHRIKRETGACVVALAHTGKNEKAGIRGHSSQKGNVDTVLEIIVHNKETVADGKKVKVIEHDITLGTPRSANVRKQRDGDSNGKWAFTLTLHETATRDARGRPVKSPALQEAGLDKFKDLNADDVEADAPRPLTKREREAADVLQKLKARNEKLGMGLPTLTQFQKALKRAGWGPKNPSTWRSVFRLLKRKLDLDSNDAVLSIS